MGGEKPPTRRGMEMTWKKFEGDDGLVMMVLMVMVMMVIIVV